MRLFANRVRERTNPRVGTDPFAVDNAGIDQLSRDSTIDIHAGDHEWPKKIAFAAFIDAEVRLEHFRRVHLLIAELRFAQNFWLELELYELLDAFSLEQKLRPFLVDGRAELVLLREKERVGFRRECEAGLLEQGAQLFRLFVRERLRIGIHRDRVTCSIP